MKPADMTSPRRRSPEGASPGAQGSVSKRAPGRVRDNERPLADDIRLLGRILGDVIREQDGTKAYELVEQVRKLSVAFRRDADQEADKALKKLLKSLSGEQAVNVIRAFTYFSHLANLAEDRHHIRRRAKYFPRARPGTTSAIQLTHTGPPTAFPACARKYIGMNTPSATGAAAIPYRPTIHTGTTPSATHSPRWKYNPQKKIRRRAPVRSISKLAGSDTSAARYGTADRIPTSSGDAPSARANSVNAAPLTVTYHTFPNIHATVDATSASRSGFPVTDRPCFVCSGSVPTASSSPWANC